MKTRSPFSVILIMLLSILLLTCKGKEEAATEILRPVRYEKVIMYGGDQTRTFSLSVC